MGRERWERWGEGSNYGQRDRALDKCEFKMETDEDSTSLALQSVILMSYSNISL